MPNTEIAPIVRSLLEQERQEKGWTKEQQAGFHQIDPATIWRWERGIFGRGPSILINLILKNTGQKQAA